MSIRAAVERTVSEAPAPPEHRGLSRDGVRLLVAERNRITHAVFRELPDHLRAGDLLVVNVSATLPAAVDMVRHGISTSVHVSAQLDDGQWVVEVRRPDNDGPATDVTSGEVLRLPGGQRLRVVRRYPDDEQDRLWAVTPIPATSTRAYLSRHGRPISYRYLDAPPSLADVQNVYATEPGSAEMPSAGRPLTESLLVRLMAKGVVVAPVLLHTGVSSQEAHEPPMPEPFTVPESTARLVNSASSAGRRVVAVGTTVTRALETVASRRGMVHPATGWTSLVLGPDRPARVVTGLVTGLHAPGASHLRLLEAVAGQRLVDQAYDAAVGSGYLWHEFGDSTLLLP